MVLGVVDTLVDVEFVLLDFSNSELCSGLGAAEQLSQRALPKRLTRIAPNPQDVHSMYRFP